MNKLYIYIAIIFAFFTIIGNNAYASSSKNTGETGFNGKHSEHPPHDHHDPDHLKYIRHNDKRKNKAIK